MFRQQFIKGDKWHRTSHCLLFFSVLGFIDLHDEWVNKGSYSKMYTKACIGKGEAQLDQTIIPVACSQTAFFAYASLRKVMNAKFMLCVVF